MREIKVGMRVRVREDMKGTGVISITDDMYGQRGNVLTIEELSSSHHFGIIYRLSDNRYYDRRWFDPIDDLTLYELVE